MSEETKGNTKEMSQKVANQRAAIIGFEILYNKGETWPEELYLDNDGVELSEGDKIKMHKGYSNMLFGLAKRAGKTPKKQTTIVYD